MIRKINEALSIAAQPSSYELEQIAKAGFCSILNLRSLLEPESLPNEQEISERWGLSYRRVPFQLCDIQHLNHLETVLNSIKHLPKPLLIHCDDSVRASVIALLKVAVDQGFSLVQAQEKLRRLKLNDEYRALSPDPLSGFKRKAIRFSSVHLSKEKSCFPHSSTPTPLSMSSQSLHCS